MHPHPPGTVVLQSVVASSGHPIHLVSLVGVYSRILSNHDSKLDDEEFIKFMFANSKKDIPPKPKIEWMINCSGIGIYEKSTNYFFIIQDRLN